MASLSLYFMKYCSNCKRIFNTNTDECPKCSRRLIAQPSGESPVVIKLSGGFEAERIIAALKDEGIPSYQKEAKGSAGLRILNSAAPEESEIYVPLSAYNKAVDVLVGIGALNPDEDEVLDVDDSELPPPPMEEMSSRKRFWVRILSIILFIAVVWIVISLTDFCTAWIKSLF